MTDTATPELWQMHHGTSENRQAWLPGVAKQYEKQMRRSKVAGTRTGVAQAAPLKFTSNSAIRDGYSAPQLKWSSLRSDLFAFYRTYF